MIWRERVRLEVLKVLESHDVFGRKDQIARDIADALPSPDERNGYVVVPSEPTKEMYDAALPFMDSWSSNRAWWDAMLKAAS